MSEVLDQKKNDRNSIRTKISEFWGGAKEGTISITEMMRGEIQTLHRSRTHRGQDKTFQ